MASAKDIISRALNACGGVFRPSMDEDKTLGEKTKFNVTPNGSDEVVYSFRVKIDKKKYQSLTNPGEGAGAEDGKASSQNASAQDEAIALDANQEVQQAMRECAATIEQCRARNKIACPYHGAKIIEMDIMQRLQNLGVNAVPKVEADKDRRGRPTGTYMIQIPCMDVRAERDKVERAINEFMQTPGVAEEEGRDAENDWTDDIHELEEGGSPAESGYTSFFEVDRLDPNATSEAEAHVDEPVDEEEDNEEDGEENETPETERNEEATPSVQEEPTTASERPGNETAESGEENAPRAENANRTASGANQEVVDYLRGQLENENLPQSVRDFLQGQLDLLGQSGEESGENESHSEPREPIDWEEQARRDREFSEAIRNANWETASSQTESTSETAQRAPVRRPTEEQNEETGAARSEARTQNWEEMDPNTRDYWLARYNADNGNLASLSDDEVEDAHVVLGSDDPLLQDIMEKMASERRARSTENSNQGTENAPDSANAVHAHAGETDPMPGNGNATTQNQVALPTRGQENSTNEEGEQVPTSMTRDQRLRYLQDQMEAAGLHGRPFSYDDDENDYFVLGYDSEDENASLEAHIDNEGRVIYFVINNDEGVEYERGTDLADVMRRSGRNWTAPGNGNTTENNQVEAQTRGQESAANSETPQQNADARESRVLHRIDNAHMDEDIAPDVMDALHAELRRAGRRKTALFAESGRDQTSPAFAAGKRFSSYERALGSILRGHPTTYQDLLDRTSDYAWFIADSEETRHLRDGTTLNVRGFNPETGEQTTPHKRAIDAARFIAHLIGQHVEMNRDGTLNFTPGVENETLPPLTFETSASHAAHRQAMQAAANANAQTTSPRPQPTRREFFAAPTGTEGRIDTGSERANSIRANAQTAANSARSSRVRNILSRIARPQQQPEERLD